MGLLTPHNPLYNTIIVYIIVITLFLIIKPEIIYSKKNNRLKDFGADEDQTFTPLSLISIVSSVFLYIIFSMLDSVCSVMNNE